MRDHEEVCIDDDIELEPNNPTTSPVKVIVRVFKDTEPEVIGIYNAQGHKIPIARLERAGHVIDIMERVYGEWAKEILELREGEK